MNNSLINYLQCMALTHGLFFSLFNSHSDRYASELRTMSYITRQREEEAVFKFWVSFAYGVCTCDTINNKEKGTKEKQKSQIRIVVYGADLA